MAMSAGVAYGIMAATAVAGAAVSYRTAQTQSMYAEYEAEQQTKQLEAQAKQEELSRTQALRQALATNKVQAAVSGVSINEGTPAEFQEQSLSNYDYDMLSLKTNKMAAIASTQTQGKAAQSAYKAQGYGSLLQGLGSAATAYGGFKQHQAGKVS